jgi:hypothetical protein
MATSPRTNVTTPVNAAYVEKLLAEKEDMIRRIKERDERSTELMKQVAAAQLKAQKATDALAAEQAETQAAQFATARAKEKIAELEEKLRQLQLENERGKLTAAAKEDKLGGVDKMHRDAVAQLAESRVLCAQLQAQAAAAEGKCEEMRAERTRREAAEKDQEAEREAARREAMQQQQALAAAQAKAQAGEEAAIRMVEQMDRERESLTKQRDHTQQRLEEAQKRKDEESEEREKAVTAAAVAKTECQAASEMASRATQQWKHEVDNAAMAWKELEAFRAELGTCRRKLEVADRERAARESHWAAMKEQLRYAKEENMRLENERRTLVIAEAAAQAQREVGLERRVTLSPTRDEPYVLPYSSRPSALSPPYWEAHSQGSPTHSQGSPPNLNGGLDARHAAFSHLSHLSMS